ncbi:helix-turn-helix domain-containing protein [Corynebacterium freneyi]
MPQSPAHLSAAQLARQERRRMGLGRKISELRRDRGMTQQQLADAAGISKRGVIRVEQGRTSLTVDVFFRLADALAVRPSRLMALVEEWEAETAGGGEEGVDSE